MISSYDRCDHAAKRLAAAVVLVLAANLAGCGGPKVPTHLPRFFAPEPFDASVPGAFDIDADSKYAFFESKLRAQERDLPRMDNRDFAMLAANRAMIRLALGEIEAARTDALDAQAVMTGEVVGESAKAVAAALADERAKVFKGEGYEIAMLNSIVGLCSLQLDDSEMAAIGFRRALEADKMSKEAARDDFVLAYWGLGMAHLDRDMEAARQAFDRCGYKDAETVQGENMVFLIALGKAPWKELFGLYGEQDKLSSSLYEPTGAEVFVDGESLGRSFKLIDLYQQAQGVPRSAKDVGQGVKAGGKFALALVAGAVLGDAGSNLVESGWSVKADTRTCYMLPNEIHVASARVAPGPHTINVRFYNAAGAPLERYEQVWHYVVAPDAGRSYVNIRSEFDRCNVQGPVAFTRINSVKTKKVKVAETRESSPPTGEKPKVTFVKFRSANLAPLNVGDTITLCHSYGQTEYRMDNTYHWRHQPMAYNNKGEPIGYPDCQLRMRDFDIGVVGKAEVTEIKGKTTIARVTSLNSEYKPRVGDWVTAAKKVGRLWK